MRWEYGASLTIFQFVMTGLGKRKMPFAATDSYERHHYRGYRCSAVSFWRCLPVYFIIVRARTIYELEFAFYIGDICKLLGRCEHGVFVATVVDVLHYLAFDFG